MKHVPPFLIVFGIFGIVIWTSLDAYRDISATNQAMAKRRHVENAIEDYVAAHSSDELASSSSSSSDASEPSETETLTLVDQKYPDLSQVHGAAWLRAIGAVKLTGYVEDLQLDLLVGRVASDRSWSAVGMYIAPLDSNGWPIESVYGTNLHFIEAEWNGHCARSLSPSSSFGLHSHSADLAVDGSDVKIAKGNDGCETGQNSIDLERLINEGGVLIGFAPSAPGYSVRVDAKYIGDLAVEPF